MFGRPVASYVPDPDTKAVADAAYRPLVDGVQRCLDGGALVAHPTEGAAERIAFYLWAVSHGMVSLELAGQMNGDEDQRAAAYTDALILSSTPFLA